MKEELSNHIFSIIEKNLHRMSFQQKESIRNQINSDILRQIEGKNPFLRFSSSQGLFEKKVRYLNSTSPPRKVSFLTE